MTRPDPALEFLDWPFFETLHRELWQEVHRFRETIPRTLDEGDEPKICRDLVARLGGAGLLEHAVHPADVRSLCLMRDALAQHHSLADFAFAMQGLGSAPIRLFGTEAQQNRFLPGTEAGELIAAFALSEPEAGSDVGAIATTATLDGDQYVLDGEKTWISNGGIADYYVVFARSEDPESSPGTRGLSAFVVDADAPGLEVSQTIEVVAPHPLATLRFDGCKVPKDRLLGERGQGFRAAMATLDVFRPSVGAAALGFARRALAESRERVESRSQFGKKLAEFQLTQARLAEMDVRVDASALLVYRAAWTLDSGAKRATRVSSMAKLYATEAAQRVVDDAVQLFGAEGVVKGGVPERLYREVRALRIYEGTSEIQKLIIAKELRR